MECHAVRSIHCLRTTFHHDDVLLIVDLECCDRSLSVVDNGNVLLIREERDVLRIVAGNRQGKFLLKDTVRLIDLEAGDGGISGSGTEYILTVIGETHSGCGIVRISCIGKR